MTSEEKLFLNGYRLDIFRPQCNPSFRTLHCIARLDEDVSEVLPYLNAVLGGLQYTREPPSVTFSVHGKLITVQAGEIAVNALKDPEEAEKILGWLKREINETWARRHRITPRFEGISKPKVLEVLKFLPRNNCGACGEPTCMVFAVGVTEGVRGPEDCPPLSEREREGLIVYLSRFPVDSQEAG